MSDIVKRLYEESQEVTDSLYYQAANTIEQLRAELKVLDEIEIARWQTIQAHNRHIAELTAELTEIKSALNFWERASATGTKNRMYDYRMRLSAEVSENKKLRAELAALREWKDAVDNELVTMQSTTDSYPNAKTALDDLIGWHVAVATDPAVGGAALREQEPVRFERRSFRKGELFRDWHTSTASEVKSIGERTRFVNELGEEWIHETRKLYTTPRPTIPEGYTLVPIQPNEAMLDVILNTHDVYGFAADLYKAMLDAAKETDHGN